MCYSSIFPPLLLFAIRGMRRFAAGSSCRVFCSVRATVASSFEQRSSNAGRFRTFFRGICPLAVGFAAGWGLFHVVDTNGFVSDDLKMRLGTIALQHTEAIKKIFTRSGTSGDDAAREVQPKSTFRDVLEACRVEEQLDWLVEHAADDIPHLYTADLFEQWAGLHLDIVESTHTPLASYAIGPAFEAPELCSGIFRRMADGVLPFDVGAKCLWILSANRCNAKHVLEHCQLTPQDDVLRELQLKEGSAASPFSHQQSMLLLHRRERLSERTVSTHPDATTRASSSEASIALLGEALLLKQQGDLSQSWLARWLRPSDPLSLPSKGEDTARALREEMDLAMDVCCAALSSQQQGGIGTGSGPTPCSALSSHLSKLRMIDPLAFQQIYGHCCAHRKKMPQ